MFKKLFNRRSLPIESSPNDLKQKSNSSLHGAIGFRNALISNEKQFTKITPPFIINGVVPDGKQAQIALDSNPCYGLPINQLFGTGAYMPNGFIPFPGFQFLASLTTRVEYRNLHETLADEITREWIEFVCNDTEGDTNDKIKKIEDEFKRLNIKDVIHRAVVHDAAYGRAQLFFDFDGYAGADTSLPIVLDPGSVPIGSLKAVTNIEAMWTTPTFYNANDPTAPDFYKPDTWFMLGKEVHSSRLMTIVTRELPDILKPAYNFAGMSLSQLCEGYIINWLNIRQSVTDIVRMFSTTGLGTSMGSVLNGQDYGGATGVLARVEAFVTQRNNRGVLAYDKETEELKQLNAPLTNLDKLQAQGIEHICTAARIPSVKYTGLSPTGLNASSEGELEAYRDSIHGMQEGFWLRPLLQILNLVQLSLFGEIDASITIRFKSLKQTTEEAKAEIRAKDTVRDVSYVTAGVISKIEVRERLSKDVNSGYSNIDSDELPELEPGADGSDSFNNQVQAKPNQQQAKKSNVDKVDKNPKGEK